jgi:glycosyltransferase involved in cell wall biosynthesis
MRICLLIPGSLDTVSGGCLYDRQLVALLRERGHHVDVESLPLRSYTGSLPANLDPRLPRRLANGGYDLLLQDELAHAALFAANPAIKRKVRCPVVPIVHHLFCCEPEGSPLLGPLWRRVERRYLRTADAMILASRHAKQCCRDLLSELPEHVVAPPGADHAGPAASPESVSARSKESGPLRLLFVGNISARKGILPTLSSLARIPDTPWELRLAGDTRRDPRSTERIRRFLRRHGLRDRVRLLGRVPDVELGRLYRESHVLCMPFAFEGYGIVFLEAMAAGLPVLARRGCGAEEIVRHGENGYLFDPADTGGPASRIRELARDRERLASMGLAAREAFLRHPTWERSMGQVEGFLAGLCRRDRSG